MKNKIKICAVVQGATLPAFQKNLQAAAKASQLVELRTDFIKGLKPVDVKKLKPAGKTSSIFTCRSIREGGKFSGSRAEQDAILDAAFGSGFNYVDVAADNPYIAGIDKKQQKKLLLSYHDFKGTPSSIELMGRIERMQEFSPAIIKIATMVKKTKDIFTLTEVLKQKKDDQKLIIIGMGEAGKITRILFPLLGSYLTYASLGSETAPGMLTASQLRTVYSNI
jgi:3-dehydroquinate dehydratase type I